MSSAVRLGIIGSLLLVIWGLITHFANLHTQQWPLLVSITIVVAVTAMSCISYKTNEGKGFLTFGEGMKSGMQTVFIVVVISVIYGIVYAKIINPNLVNTIKDNAIAQMEAKNTPDEQINMSVQYIEKYYLVVFTVFITLLYLFLGLVTSLITSAIIKKEKPVDMNTGTN